MWLKHRLVASCAVAAAISAGLPQLAVGAPESNLMPTAGGMGGTISSSLSAMPSGTATISPLTPGRYAVRLNAVGLTPGSVHAVDVGPGQCTIMMRASSRAGSLGSVTANAVGQLRATLRGVRRGGSLPRSLLIRLGDATTMQAGVDPMQPIACATLPRHVNHATVRLQSLSPTGMHLSGGMWIKYDQATDKLTVHVSAHGLTPGKHAAHIHAGSCQRQGDVLYMLPDLIAGANGSVNQTVTITDGATAPPATGWYLNIHQGSSNTILSHGQPTLSFRPLLCANIAGEQTSTPMSGQVTTSHGEKFFSVDQTDQPLLTVGPFRITVDCTAVQSDGQSYNQVAFNVVSSEDGSDLDGTGPAPAGTVVNIHTDSDLKPNPQGADPATPPLPNGSFSQTPSASTSTEIAPDGTEVDLFYNDGVNLNGHACFAGAVALMS